MTTDRERSITLPLAHVRRVNIMVTKLQLCMAINHKILAKRGSYVSGRKAPWDYQSQVSVSYLISFKEVFPEYLCSNFSTLPAPSLPTHAPLNLII